MKILVTSGHPHSGYDIVQQIVQAAGLSGALPSRREGMTVDELHANIFKAHEYATTGLDVYSAIEPGKVWQEVGVDLFLGNLSQALWGWADARSTWLLEFWKNFDKQTRFMLVYCAPAAAVGQMLEKEPYAIDNIDAGIASWIAYNAELLRFYHRNRERCLLINATAAMQAPARLIEKAAPIFGQCAIAADFSLKQGAFSIITARLAEDLVENYSDAAALYQELESAADLSLEQGDGQETAKLQAWREYMTLRLHSEDLQHSLQQQVEQVASLQAKHSELAKKLQDQEKQSGDLAKARDTQEKQFKDAAQENELLLLQLHQVQEELEHYFLRHEELTKLHDEQAKLAANRQKQLEQMTQAREQQTQITAERTKQIEKVCQARDRQAQLAAERQQQIEELQQALATIDQAAAQQEEIDQLIAYARFWRSHQPTQVVVDLRREIDGDNWYHAEEDGRWAGPGSTSVIRVPSLRDGKYTLQLEIVDAMGVDIAEGTTVSLNGMPLDVSVNGEGYPLLLNASFSTDMLPESLIWQFALQYPRLASPATSGSPDERSLAIRLAALKLESTN